MYGGWLSGLVGSDQWKGEAVQLRPATAHAKQTRRESQSRTTVDDIYIYIYIYIYILHYLKDPKLWELWYNPDDG